MSPELRDVQDIMPMSSEDLERLTADIKVNGIRHPVIVYRKGGTLYVLAGWHRREIAVKLGIPVPVEEVEGTAKERREFCITENLARRHLTATQKRDIIEYLLKVNPSKSNKSLAKETGTTKETVKAARGRLEAGGEIRPLNKVKGTDGKTYKHTPNQRRTNEGYRREPTPTDNIITAIGDYLDQFDAADREKAKAELIAIIRDLP